MTYMLMIVMSHIVMLNEFVRKSFIHENAYVSPQNENQEYQTSPPQLYQILSILQSETKLGLVQTFRSRVSTLRAMSAPVKHGVLWSLSSDKMDPVLLWHSPLFGLLKLLWFDVNINHNKSQIRCAKCKLLDENDTIYDLWGAKGIRLNIQIMNMYLYFE